MYIDLIEQIILFLSIIIAWWGVTNMLDKMIEDTIFNNVVTMILGLIMLMFVDGEIYKRRKYNKSVSANNSNVN